MKLQNVSILVLVTAFCMYLFTACGGEKKESLKLPEDKGEVIVPDGKIELWNGKDFNGWTRYIPDSGIDVNNVWMNQGGILHCTGSPAGYIKTNNKYANYILTVEWRWPAEPGNSGVLLHMSEPDVVWPKSIEAQLMHENAGDFWMIEGTTIKEQVDKSERRVEKREPSSENAPGEWNIYKIVCQDDQIQVKVNGVLQNVGTEASVKSGKICFQSEGKPIEFRTIYLEPIE